MEAAYYCYAFSPFPSLGTASFTIHESEDVRGQWQ